MSQFYTVFLSPRVGTKSEDIQSTMDLAIDWFKCDEKNWIVYTTSDSKKWYSRLEKYCNPGGYVFIAKIDRLDSFGFMDPALWAWFKKWAAKEQ